MELIVSCNQPWSLTSLESILSFDKGVKRVDTTNEEWLEKQDLM